jgi:pentatricopeptide repeat protein
MAQHASRKQLIEAKEIFDKLESAGTANDHTYAVIINACVRCGDIESALKLHGDMIQNKCASIQGATAAVKGLVTAGRFDEVSF